MPILLTFTAPVILFLPPWNGRRGGDAVERTPRDSHTEVVIVEGVAGAVVQDSTDIGLP